MQLGNEDIKGSGRRLTLPEVKSNILVATRQYAKRQLTWFARENKLTSVMLTGHPSFSAALRVQQWANGSVEIRMSARSSYGAQPLVEAANLCM